MLQHNEEPSQLDIDRALASIQQKGVSASAKPPLMVNIERIQKAQNGGFPQDCFHPTLASRPAYNDAQLSMLISQGYRTDYIHCTHPRWMHRRNMTAKFDPERNPDFFDAAKNSGGVPNPFTESRLVKSPEEERKLMAAPKTRDCGPWVSNFDKLEPIPDTPGIEDANLEMARLLGRIEELQKAVAAKTDADKPAAQQKKAQPVQPPMAA